MANVFQKTRRRFKGTGVGRKISLDKDINSAKDLDKKITGQIKKSIRDLETLQPKDYFNGLARAYTQPYKWAYDTLKDSFIPDIDFPKDVETGIYVNLAGGDVKLPVVYGRRKLGGIRVFAGSSGSTNEYLHIVLSVCEGEIDGFENIYLNDDDIGNPIFYDPDATPYVTGTVSTTAGSPTVTGSGTFTAGMVGHVFKLDADSVGVPIKSYDSATQVTLEYDYPNTAAAAAYSITESLVQAWRYEGTTTQLADSTLTTAFPGVWTSSHQGKGVAYIAVRLKWSKGVFKRSLPNLNCIVRGKKCYRTRTTDTAYTTNPSECIRDYLLSSVYGKGDTLTASDIDDTLFEDAADYYDEQITKHTSGPNIDRFQVNGIVDTNNTLIANLKALRSSCQSHLTFTAGKYALIAEKDESSSMTITQDHIIGQLVHHGVDATSKYNLVKARFTNGANWQSDSQQSSVAADNGLLLKGEFGLHFEILPERAKYHTEIILKRSRLDLYIQIVLDHRFYKIEVGNVIALTYYTRWTAKLFRVMRISLIAGSGAGLMACDLMEHSSATYDRTVPAEIANPPNTSLPDPAAALPPTSLVITGGDSANARNERGNLILRAKMAWTAPADAFVDHYEVQKKRNGDSKWSAVVTETSDEHYVWLEDIHDNWDFRVRSLNAFGTPSVWVESLDNDINPDSSYHFRSRLESLDGYVSTTTAGGTIALNSDGYVELTYAASGDTAGLDKFSGARSSEFDDFDSYIRVMRAIVSFTGDSQFYDQHTDFFHGDVNNNNYFGFSFKEVSAGQLAIHIATRHGANSTVTRPNPSWNITKDVWYEVVAILFGSSSTNRYVLYKFRALNTSTWYTYTQTYAAITTDSIPNGTVTVGKQMIYFAGNGTTGLSGNAKALADEFEITISTKP